MKMASDAKWTKGPWRKSRRLNSVGAPITSGGRYVILQEGASKREDFFICEMPFAAVRSGDEREHEANADLITAAPELYEALNRLRAAFDGLRPFPAVAEAVAHSLVIEADAALAKARGEQTPQQQESAA